MKKILLLTILFLTPQILLADTKYNQVRDFEFIDLEGIKHKFSDYKGKWVLVNYWASYCSPCRAEIPDIQRFLERNKDKIVVLGMDAGGSDKDEIKAFKKELSISYPLIPMQESSMLAFGLLMAIPTSYIVSPKGEIVDKRVGIITYADLDYYVNPPTYNAEIQTDFER